MSLENKNNISKDEMRDERDEYNEITREIKEESRVPFNQKEHDSKSRYKITIIFIRCYFGFLLFLFILIAAYNCFAVVYKFDTLNLKDILSLFVASFGSTLGFIIGYYFKAGDKG